MYDAMIALLGEGILEVDGGPKIAVLACAFVVCATVVGLYKWIRYVFF